MSWLYERLTVQSNINGPISCTRILGKWLIATGKYGQSSDYLDTLWKKALHKVPKDVRIRNILMLGLGTGRTLPIYRKRFPHAKITAIEIDPEMVALMRRFSSPKDAAAVNVLTGDANTVLPTLDGRFDLVVFDMFIGKDVASVTRDKTLIGHALRLLDPHGALLVNAYLESDVLDLFGTACAEIRRWKYISNHVGLFRPWGSGTMGDPLPEGYRYYRASADFLEREFKVRNGIDLIHTGEAVGSRKKFQLFEICHYLGDAEPSPLPTKTGPRLTIWQTCGRVDKPAGWHRWPVQGNRHLTGFARIPAEGRYDLDWSEHARRHCQKWRKQTKYRIEDTDVETFVTVYKTCKKSRTLLYLFSAEMRRKQEAHGDRIRFRVAREIATGQIISGFVSLWIPETRQTFHVTSFITEDGKETPAAYGLVDDVFAIAQARGDQFLEFDGFWAPGDPSEAKGYSRFKAQFNPYYILWPKPLVRFD